MSPGILLKPTNLKLFAVAIPGWIALYSVIIYEVFDLSLRNAILQSVVCNGVLIVTLMLTANVLRYYQPTYDRSIFLVSLAALLAVSVAWIDRISVGFLMKELNEYTESSAFLYFHGGFALVAHLAVNTLIMQRMQLMEQSAVQKQIQETERLNREAELFKLRHQLQPHFLFNSLNSISALITSQPERARTMVQQLSTFLRGTIHQNDQNLVSFEDEWEHLQLYLEIEQVRFSHRLKVTSELTSDVGKAKLPPLLIQPLLENAIKFGLYGTTEQVVIDISAHLNGNKLLISVSNPLDRGVSDTEKGTGFGLKSIRRRLQLTFGRSDLLVAEAGEEIFTVHMTIPQQP